MISSWRIFRPALPFQPISTSGSDSVLYGSCNLSEDALSEIIVILDQERCKRKVLQAAAQQVELLDLKLLIPGASLTGCCFLAAAVFTHTLLPLCFLLDLHSESLPDILLLFRQVGSDGFEKVLIGTRGARETFLRGRKGERRRTAL